MRILATAFAVAIAVTMSTTGVMAQGTTRPPIPPFDPKTVENFSGTVALEKSTGTFADVVVMMVQAGGDTRTVVLAPRRMLDPALTSVATKTPVDVTASKVLANGTPVYLASAVKVGGKTYNVRNEQGKVLNKGKPTDQK